MAARSQARLLPFRDWLALAELFRCAFVRLRSVTGEVLYGTRLGRTGQVDGNLGGLRLVWQCHRRIWHTCVVMPQELLRMAGKKFDLQQGWLEWGTRQRATDTAHWLRLARVPATDGEDAT
jgi:hypothetical protein